MRGDMTKVEQRRHVAHIVDTLTAGGYELENVRDALADLLHACSLHNVDFEVELASARGHFQAEKGGEDGI